MSRRKYKVILNDKHVYHVLDNTTGQQIQGKIWTVSTISNKIYEFHAETALQRMNPENRKSKYGDLDDDSILKIWRQNSTYTSRCGIAMHKLLEKYLRNVKDELTVIPPPIVSESPIVFDETHGVIITEKHLAQFQNYIHQHSMIPVCMEHAVFSKDLMVAGTFDCLLKDDAGELILLDYKRRKELNHENYKKAVIQCNLYRQLYEQETSLKISKMFIVSIFPTNENIIFDPIEIADVIPQVKDFLTEQNMIQTSENKG